MPALPTLQESSKTDYVSSRVQSCPQVPASDASLARSVPAQPTEMARRLKQALRIDGRSDHRRLGILGAVDASPSRVKGDVPIPSFGAYLRDPKMFDGRRADCVMDHVLDPIGNPRRGGGADAWRRAEERRPASAPNRRRPLPPERIYLGPKSTVGLTFRKLEDGLY